MNVLIQLQLNYDSFVLYIVLSILHGYFLYMELFVNNLYEQ